MLKIPDEYFDELEQKLQSGTATEDDEEEFMQNMTEIYTKVKKIVFMLLYGGLISILIGVSAIFLYFYLSSSEYDTEATNIIYILISGLGFLGLGGGLSYYSLNKMPLLNDINDEFGIEEDDD